MAYIVPGAGLGGERKSRWQRIKERLKGAPGRWGKRKAQFETWQEERWRKGAAREEVRYGLESAKARRMEMQARGEMARARMAREQQMRQGGSGNFLSNLGSEQRGFGGSRPKGKKGKKGKTGLRFAPRQETTLDRLARL